MQSFLHSLCLSFSLMAGAINLIFVNYCNTSKNKPLPAEKWLVYALCGLKLDVRQSAPAEVYTGAVVCVQITQFGVKKYRDALTVEQEKLVIT